MSMQLGLWGGGYEVLPAQKGRKLLLSVKTVRHGSPPALRNYLGSRSVAVRKNTTSVSGKLTGMTREKMLAMFQSISPQC